MKKLTAIVLALVLALSAVSAFAETLIMETNASFPPYEFVDNGEVVGIDAEIAAAICAKLGYDLEIVDTEFGSLIGDVVSGKCTFAMAGMSVTEERKLSVDFSDSYAGGVQVIIVKENSPITSVDDLKDSDYIIGVQDATTGCIYATGDFKNVNVYLNGNEAVMSLVGDKIDCVIIDSQPAKEYVAANAGLKILETSYVEEEYAAAFSKENTELLAAFNQALAELKADGTIDAIIAKYIKAE